MNGGHLTCDARVADLELSRDGAEFSDINFKWKLDMNLIDKLLRKNTSPARVAAFMLSNFLGLVIIIGAIQFYQDAKSVWDVEDSFLNTDYMVVNKIVDGSNILGDERPEFSTAEIDELRRQPWVRSVGEFRSTDYRVWASVGGGARSMQTMMFFESVPDEFVDVYSGALNYKEGDGFVPMIISKDYLALYNFGFAGSAGLPRMSEQIMSGIPISLELTSDDGQRRLSMEGRVVGFSNRLNTILVPDSFMQWSNARLGNGAEQAPSRLIIDVSRPGDVAIADYLKSHHMDVAGDKSASSAAFMLRVVVGIVVAIGVVITLLSLFILLLSVSLLMEKNRSKLHTLLMLGYSLPAVGKPYKMMVTLSSLTAGVLALVCVFVLRGFYMAALQGLGAQPTGCALAVVVCLCLTGIIILLNIVSVSRKVRGSWR